MDLEPPAEEVAQVAGFQRVDGAVLQVGGGHVQLVDSHVAYQVHPHGGFHEGGLAESVGVAQAEAVVLGQPVDQGRPGTDLQLGQRVDVQAQAGGQRQGRRALGVQSVFEEAFQVHLVLEVEADAVLVGVAVHQDVRMVHVVNVLGPVDQAVMKELLGILGLGGDLVHPALEIGQLADLDAVVHQPHVDYPVDGEMAVGGEQAEISGIEADAAVCVQVIVHVQRPRVGLEASRGGEQPSVEPHGQVFPKIDLHVPAYPPGAVGLVVAIGPEIRPFQARPDRRRHRAESLVQAQGQFGGAVLGTAQRDLRPRPGPGIAEYHVHDPGVGVGAVQRRSRPPDDFDALDLLHVEGLQRPGGKTQKLHGGVAVVHQQQHAVGVDRGVAAYPHLVPQGIEHLYVHVGHQPQDLRQGARPGVLDFLAGDHRDRRGRLGDGLLVPGGGDHHAQELFQIQFLEVGDLLLAPGGSRQQEQRQNGSGESQIKPYPTSLACADPRPRRRPSS